MSVEQSKTAIEQLSIEERAELAAWLHGWQDDEWDEQIKRDVASGKFDHILREVETSAPDASVRCHDVSRRGANLTALSRQVSNGFYLILLTQPI